MFVVAERLWWWRRRIQDQQQTGHNTKAEYGTGDHGNAVTGLVRQQTGRAFAGERRRAGCHQFPAGTVPGLW